jgi:hypothetical protein
MSFYYKPEWCLYAASEVERNQAAKKRFVDEYESNVCYRKEAKNLLNDKIMGLTEVVPSRRADTVKVAAVMSYLLFNENKPKWTKLVQLLGRDFSYMPRMVSAMYAGTKAAYDFTDEINKPENVAKRYLFFLYGYASPESQLSQNKDVYDIWTRNLANSEGEDSAIQREFFAKLGTGVQKTISDLQNKVIADMNKATIDVKVNDNLTIQKTEFSDSNYSIMCDGYAICEDAMCQAGVSFKPVANRPLTKQEFRNMQANLAEDVQFVCKEDDDSFCFGMLEALVMDGLITVDDKNNMLISQKVSQQTLNLINLYNFMLPVYASVYNLANAYADEIRRAVSRELFGQDEGTSDEMLVKQIDALNKKLVDAEACVERAENKAADADKLLQQSKKRENALTSKLETAYAEIDELMQLVPEETEDDLPDEQEALEEETLQPDDEPDVDYGKKLDELLQKYSVAVVGGNQNLMKRFQVLHPDAIYVSKDMVAACGQMIHAADLVLCKVDSMSHALYNKCKVTCHRYDVQMNYLPNVTSCTRLEKCMCEMIEALSA